MYRRLVLLVEPHESLFAVSLYVPDNIAYPRPHTIHSARLPVVQEVRQARVDVVKLLQECIVAENRL